jgi:hypothetical protein
MNDDGKVGDKHPPKTSQWKKGQSGNRHGRTKGSRNLATELINELQEKLRISERGVSKTITKQQALIKALIAKSLQGDMRAISIVFSTLRLIEPQFIDVTTTDLFKEDRDILDAYVARVVATNKAKS